MAPQRPVRQILADHSIPSRITHNNIFKWLLYRTWSELPFPASRSVFLLSHDKIFLNVLLIAS